jgi:hypothetical protein
MRSLAIPAEGRAHVLDMPAATAAAELIDGPLTVATCHHPQLDRTHVLFLGDFSAVDGSPLNRRAWALYGGSPLHGMVVLGADDREPLDPDVIAMVTDEAFPGPEMVETMDRWLAANRPWSDES